MADETEEVKVLQEPITYSPGGRGGITYAKGTLSTDMSEEAVEAAEVQGLFDPEAARGTVASHLGAFSRLSADDVSMPATIPTHVVGKKVGANAAAKEKAEKLEARRAAKEGEEGEEVEEEVEAEDPPPTPPQFDTLATDDASHPAPPPPEGTVPPAPTSAVSTDDASHPATAPASEEMTAGEKQYEQQMNPSEPSTGRRGGPDTPDQQALDDLSKDEKAKDQADNPSEASVGSRSASKGDVANQQALDELAADPAAKDQADNPSDPSVGSSYASKGDVANKEALAELADTKPASSKVTVGAKKK